MTKPEDPTPVHVDGRAAVVRQDLDNVLHPGVPDGIRERRVRFRAAQLGIQLVVIRDIVPMGAPGLGGEIR